jgi:thiol-disulfide isomerase/thioredoxin
MNYKMSNYFLLVAVVATSSSITKERQPVQPIMPTDEYTEIKSIEQYNGIVTNGRPSVCYCHTPYCDACKDTNKSFQEAARKHHGRANFVKVDLDKDELKPIGAKYEIKAVPTTVFRQPNGKIKESIRGSRDKKDYIKDIDNFLNGKESKPVEPTQNQQASTPAQKKPAVKPHNQAPVQQNQAECKIKPQQHSQSGYVPRRQRMKHPMYQQ